MLTKTWEVCMLDYFFLAKVIKPKQKILRLIMNNLKNESLLQATCTRKRKNFSRTNNHTWRADSVCKVIKHAFSTSSVEGSLFRIVICLNGNNNNCAVSV